MTSTAAVVLAVVAVLTSVALLVLVQVLTREVRTAYDRATAVRARVLPLLDEVTQGAERAGAAAARLERRRADG